MGTGKMALHERVEAIPVHAMPLTSVTKRLVLETGHRNPRSAGIDGLAGVVRTTLGRDPGSGDLFIFKNRRGDKLKVVAWMGDGFATYLRRLEKGTFAFPTATTSELASTTTQLAMILGRRVGQDPHPHPLPEPGVILPDGRDRFRTGRTTGTASPQTDDAPHG